MDLFEESRDDKLIEDYLFSGYKPKERSTFDADQTFARPIVDEDLFCVRDACDDLAEAEEQPSTGDLADNNTTDQFNFDDRPFRRLSDEPLCDSFADSPGGLFDDQPSDPVTPPREQQQQDDEPATVPSEIDEIFLDDYSESGDATNNENVRPTLEKSYSKPKPAALTPAQVKKKLMQERLKQQALALAKKRPRPGGIGTGFSKDGTLELQIEQSKLVSDSGTKFIFNKLFNNSKKAKDSGGSPNCDKRSWDSIRDSLRKRICSQKRKVWDSFQAPADGYNEEEELVEALSDAGSGHGDEKETEDGKPEDENSASGDGEDADVEDADEDADEDAEEDQDGDDDDEVDDDVEDGASNKQDNSDQDDDDDDDDGEIAESDLEDIDGDNSDHEGGDSVMDCKNDPDFASDSEDEVVRRRHKAYENNDDGNVGNFIDDEVEVYEDLY